MKVAPRHLETAHIQCSNFLNSKVIDGSKYDQNLFQIRKPVLVIIFDNINFFHYSASQNLNRNEPLSYFPCPMRQVWHRSLLISVRGFKELVVKLS